MKKRVLSLFMALALCLTTLPTAVFADVTENGEGSGGTHYVAESGGTQYETVQEILDNMEEGEITLLDSVTEDLTVYAATTIHMNGHSITGNIDATDSLTLNGGTVDGTVNVDGGTLNMTAPAEAEAAITGGLNVVSGSASVSGAKVGVKGTLYFDGTDMLISGAVKAVELDSAAELAAKTLYGSATVNGDTAAEAGFDTDTYKVGGEIAKKLTNKQVGSTTPAAPSLTLTETSKSLTAGKTAVFTANYTGTDTLNAYVQGSAVNGYFTISQKNNGDGTYTVSVKIDEETPGGTYTLFVHEVGNTSVQASATITVTGLQDAAEVNGKQYKSLPRALNAAQDGDTVKLLTNHVTDADALNALGENFTFEQYASIVPVVTKTLTLDLNHKTVDYLEVGFIETNEETQKKETLATGNLTVTGEAAYGRISNLMFMAGALDIRSGEIGGSECAGLLCDANSGSVTVSNGTVYGLTVLEGASVTVNGGSNHAGEWVVASSATLKITDGTFGDVQFTRNGTIAISGGTFKSIKSYIAEELQPLMSLLDTQKVHAFYKGDDVQDGNATELTDVTVKEHTHSMVNNKCACGFSCTHTNTDGTSAINKDGKCTACGTQFAAGIGETYYTDVPSALNAAADGQTVKLLANEALPSDTYVSRTLTLDLDGHSLDGYSLNVGGLTPTSQVRTGNLTVIDSSGGNGAVGVAVRNGGTLVFNPENDHTSLLQLEVWGGTVKLFGGKISRSGLRLNNSITLGNLLPRNAGLAYYRGDTQLTLEEAASQTCDLVIKPCGHGGRNGFDGNSTNCPDCNAPAVAETALNNGEGSCLQRRFADLQTALDADRDGGATLQLLADVTGDYTIDGTQDTGLDLNGHSIKGTVTVKAAAGSNTTTFSNTQNTTTASVDAVVAHRGAKLAGSRYPAVIGTLTLAAGATWKTILNDTALGYKVLNTDGTHRWYARDDVNGSQLNNVIIDRLPITSKTLNLNVDGKKLTGNPPKVERGTTVQLCASCNKGAEVTFSIKQDGKTTPITLTEPSYAGGKYTKDYSFDTIGEYTIYFTATKDGYTVQSTERKLTVTKPNLSNAEITFRSSNESTYEPYYSTTTAPGFTVTYNGKTLKLGVDYTASGTASSAGVSTQTLTIKAVEGSDYTGSKTAEWRIVPHKAKVEVGDVIKAYDGTTDLPDGKISLVSAAGSAGYQAGLPLPLSEGNGFELTDAKYDSANASETEKNISFTVKLTDTNYTFEDGTTEKAFTLNGAELDDKSFKINKAAAPTNIPTGTLSVINGTQQTYTYDFSKLLPELSEGEYGTINYGNQAAISLVSQSGYYYDETIVEFKNGVLILAQFYAKDGNMTGQIGTVKVKVTTTNYENFQLTLVLNAVDQIKPEPDGTITATPITYGDTLSKSEISGKMKDPNTGDAVNGTFTWTDGTIKPDANDRYEAEWTFTPAAGYEKYATATGTVTIKVNKAVPTFTAPTAQENLTYTGQEQALITADSVTSGGTMQYSLTENGTYSQDIPTGTDAGAYTVWYRVIGDENHNDTTPASVPVRIGQKPLTITGVTAVSKPYDGTTNAGITSVTFDGVTLNRGTDYTVAASFDDASVGNGKNVTATVTLMGQAAKNYALEQSSFPTTGSIIKAAAPDFTKETALTIVNGHEKTYTVTLPALPTLETPKEYGALTYEIGEIKLNDGYYTSGAKVENGELTLPIQKNDVETTGSVGTVTVVIKSANYEDITLTVNVNATNKLVPTVTAPTANALTYNGAEQALVTAGKTTGGTMLYRLGDSEWSEQIPTAKNAGEYTVWYKVQGNAEYADVPEQNVTVTVAKKVITVTALDQSAYTGSTAPDLSSPEADKDYKMEGLVGADTLSGTVTLDYAQTPDMSKTGETAINITGTLSNDNYEITYVSGTLTVSKQSSSDGGSSSGGSGSGGGSSSGGSNGSGSNDNTNQPEAPVTGETKPIQPDKNGNAAVDNSSVQSAIDKAKQDAKKNGTAENRIAVTVPITSAARQTSFNVTIKAQTLDLLVKENIRQFTVATDHLVSVTIGLDTLKQLDTASAGGDIILRADKVDALRSTEAKATIGTRPAYDLSLVYLSGGKETPITSLNGHTISVRLPYTPAKSEQTGNLYAVYVDDAGKVEWITKSSYNASLKAVVFETGHFSVYGVGYKTFVPAFTDITGHWAADNILFAASRGLLSGTSDTTFSPGTGMTRGMFVTALGRLAGINPDSYKTGKFTDVKADAYYAPYVNWAAQTGIVEGVTATTFAPDTNINREQMAVIMKNYAAKLGHDLPQTLKAVTFADNTQISSWAKDAVKSMQQAGILAGKSGNKFDPKGTATRAEVATVLRRFVEIVIDPQAANGWQQNDSGQWNYYRNGESVKGWLSEDQKWYWLDKATGMMFAGGWKQIDGKWYYFYPDGTMAVNTASDR